MPDLPLNAASLTTGSATGAPAMGSVETWTVPALSSKFRALGPGESYALIDATAGATAAQQAEVIRVTGCSGAGATSVTVVRGADGTTPVAHANTATFNVVVVASDLAPRFISTGLAAVLANARNKRASVVMFGDSFIEGYGQSVWDSTFPAQLAASLRGAARGGRGFIGPQADTTNHPFWPVAIAGGATVNMGYGANNRYWNLPSAGAKVTLTVPPGGLTAFDIMFFDNTTGADFYYKIDGGPAVVVSRAAMAFAVNSVRVNKPVASTVEVGFNSINTSLIGFVEYNGDELSGVQVHNAGYSGTTAAGWHAWAPNGWANAMSLLAPDLVILNLATNDARVAGGNTSSSQFKTDLTGVIADLRAATISAPVLLTAPYDPTNDAMVEPWANYVKAMRDIEAADSTVSFLNLGDWMPALSGGDTMGLLNTGSPPHPSAKGAALMADLTARALAPAARVPTPPRAARRFPLYTPDERRYYGPATADVSAIATGIAGDASFNESYAIANPNIVPANWPIDVFGWAVSLTNQWAARTSQSGTTSVATYRMMTDADEMVVYMYGAPFVSDLFVDGKPYASNPWTPQVSAGQGSYGWQKITFTSAKPRLVEFRQIAGFVAVYVKKPYRVWKPPPDTNPSIAVVGDSWVLPTVMSATTTGNESGDDYLPGIYQRMAALLGITKMTTDGIGGTGYLAPGGNSQPYNEASRLAWISAVNPDVLIVHGGGVNDFANGANWTVQQVTDAAVAYFKEARRRLPNAKLVYVEGFYVPYANFANHVTDFITLRQNVQAALAAAGVGAYFIDVVTTRPPINGTGYVTATNGSGNSDIYVGSDQAHLTTRGNQFIRHFLAPKIAKVLADTDGQLVGQLVT